MPEIRTETFDTPTPLDVNLSVAAGQVEVIAEPTTRTVVEVSVRNSADERARAFLDAARIELRGSALVVDLGRQPFGVLRRGLDVSVLVRLPEASTVHAGLAAADLSSRGTLAAVQVRTASGDVRLDDVTGDVTAHTASGDISLARVGGRADLRSSSGDVDVRSVGRDVVAHSASGDITIDNADESVRAHTASGDVSVGAAHRGAVGISSASGDVTVGVAAGVGVWLDVSSRSGSTTSDLTIGAQAPADGCQLHVSARTMSGDVHIARAVA